MVQSVHPGNGEAPLVPSKRARRIVGTARIATLCNRTSEAVRKWDRPVSKGGTGGLVPSQFQARILSDAEARGLPLTAADLIAEPVA